LHDVFGHEAFEVVAAATADVSLSRFPIATWSFSSFGVEPRAHRRQKRAE
jgi:hypothetical protein